MALPTPPATPETPPESTPATTTTTPPGGQTPKIPSPDDDPNVAMSRLVTRARERKEAAANKTQEQAKKPEKPPEKPADKATDKTEEAPPDKSKNLTELLGKALKFTQKPAKKPEEPPKKEAQEEKPPEAEAEETEEQPTPPAKPGKKATKKTPEPIDTAAIVREAATAATTAAVKALKPPKVEEEDPTDTMSSADRRDYEVAVHMAKVDPRYKEAPRIMLDQIRKAEEYASRWEAANQGKVFDPKADEHDEFFQSLDRPWSDEEFEDARIDMLADRKAEKVRAEQQKELEKIKQDAARVEYAPIVDRKFAETALSLAKAVNESFHEKLSTGGWEALSDEDPVTAKVMAATLNQMHPFIEAAVLIDDPGQRIPLNLKNPAHQQWNTVVSTGEQSLIGTRNDQGLLFAKREDYVRMNESEQARHWYLTQDMIIQGAVDYAAQQVKRVAEEQNKLLEKMGFIRQAPAVKAKTKPASKAPVTQDEDEDQPETPPRKEKPTSPGVGSGAKIDDSSAKPQTKTGALLTEMSKILFRS